MREIRIRKVKRLYRVAAGKSLRVIVMRIWIILIGKRRMRKSIIGSI